MPRFNVTTYSILLNIRYKSLPKSKDVCAVHCLFSKLGIVSQSTQHRKDRFFSNFFCFFFQHQTVLCINKFDEFSLNEIATDWLYAYTSIDVPSSDRDIFKRLYVKINEFNRDVCSESDETLRERNWRMWIKQQKRQFLNTNKIENATVFERKVFERNVRFKQHSQIFHNNLICFLCHYQLVRYLSDIQVRNQTKNPVQSVRFFFFSLKFD